ncbi:hypothetical protein FG386_001845 [Cryptosporidium ryanae]|uniref:uncharacterized protein n=1 Tax=Cryptosporidium ryanae TaxID=515981 RepID=UPI00351A6504|nr:hypothetical protein FG386_001845 [Cryptosporidium ryanae]
MSVNVPAADISSFVSWILSWISLGAYLCWMFVPDEYLNRVNITYYPDRMWGVTFPVYFFFVVIISVVTYNCISLMCMKPSNSLDLIMDESTRYIDLSLLYKFSDLDLIRLICKSTANIYLLVNEKADSKVIERNNNEERYNSFTDSKSLCIKEVFNKEGVTLDLVHLNNDIDSLINHEKSIPVADLPLPLVCEIIYSNSFLNK